MLEQLEEETQDTASALDISVRRVDRLLEASGHSHLQVILCLSVVALVLLYLVVYT